MCVHVYGVCERACVSVIMHTCVCVHVCLTFTSDHLQERVCVQMYGVCERACVSVIMHTCV